MRRTRRGGGAEALCCSTKSPPPSDMGSAKWSEQRLSEPNGNSGRLRSIPPCGDSSCDVLDRLVGTGSIEKGSDAVTQQRRAWRSLSQIPRWSPDILLCLSRYVIVSLCHLLFLFLKKRNKIPKIAEWPPPYAQRPSPRVKGVVWHLAALRSGARPAPGRTSFGRPAPGHTSFGRLPGTWPHLAALEWPHFVRAPGA